MMEEWYILHEKWGNVYKLPGSFVFVSFQKQFRIYDDKQKSSINNNKNYTPPTQCDMILWWNVVKQDIYTSFVSCYGKRGYLMNDEKLKGHGEHFIN